MLHLWHYEWDDMIKLTSCVRADDRFMTLRVRQCDQFMTVWTKPSILLLHHNYPFIENISETKSIICGSMSETRCPIYGTTSETIYFIHSDHESDQVLNIQQNEWYQIFHILTPYKATRIITKFWVWLDTAWMIHLQHFESEIRRWIDCTMNHTIRSIYDNMSDTSWYTYETMS
jgi:hypothetical protein